MQKTFSELEAAENQSDNMRLLEEYTIDTRANTDSTC